MMNCRYYIVLLLIAVNCCGFFAQTKSNNIQTIEGKKYYIHSIEKGQSLYSISKLYSVSLDDIYKLNPDAKAGTKTNQEIKIPFTSATTNTAVSTNSAVTQTSSSNFIPDTNQFKCHKVEKGQTLYSILKKYNVTEKELAQINPGFNSSIKEGQLIAISKREKTNLSVKSSSVISEIKPPDIINSSSVTTSINKPNKEAYNLALMLPFKFDQVLGLDINELVKNKSNFPPISAYAVDFYSGFKSIADSLSSNDFELNIDVYDVDEKDSLKLTQIINDEKFKKSDFIFGPWFPGGFKIISQKAKELNIPIISPTTQQNKILYNNSLTSKTNPSQFTLLETLADYCIDSLLTQGANVLLLYANERDAKEVSYVKAFKKYYNDKIKTLFKPNKDTITCTKGLAGIKSAYKTGVKNVVVSLSNNQVFLTDFCTQLAIFSDKKDIQLCGWQSNTQLDNVDQEYLNQLQYTFAHQYNLLNTNSYSVLTDVYKNQQGTLPSDYFFIGADIAAYYLKNLKLNGPNFINNLNNLPMELGYSKFVFVRPDASTGFDNRGAYIFKYNNYKVVKTGWK